MFRICCQEILIFCLPVSFNFVFVFYNPPPPHLYFFNNCIASLRILPSKIRIAFPGESQLRQSRTTQPAVHAGCFNVSTIHRTLTWTTESLACAQVLMHAIAHGVVRTHVRQSALTVDSWRKIPCRIGESNLRQRRAGQTLYHLSYIPTIQT